MCRVGLAGLIYDSQQEKKKTAHKGNVIELKLGCGCCCESEALCHVTQCQGIFTSTELCFCFDAEVGSSQVWLPLAQGCC